MPRIYLAFLTCLLFYQMSFGQTSNYPPYSFKPHNPVSPEWIIRHLQPDHPRLILTPARLEKIKISLRTDPMTALYYANIKQLADALCDVEPLLERKKIGRRLLSVSRNAIGRFTALALAANIEADSDPYIQRLNEEIVAVCHFSDWNPSHFLDVAEMSLAVSLGVDWCYHLLPASTIDLARQTLVNKALTIGIDGEVDPHWSSTNNNWNQVCNGGLSAAALFVADSEPDLAAKVLSRALRNLPNALEAYYPDGAYPEGVSYWIYATQYSVMQIELCETALHTNFKLGQAPGFEESAAFASFMVAPSGLTYNYFDCGNHINPGTYWPLLAWFQKEYSDQAYFQEEPLRQYLQSRLDNKQLLSWVTPISLVWLPDCIGKNNTAQLSDTYFARGNNPILGWRNNLDDRGFFFGAKGGRGNLNHGNMDGGSFVLELDGIRWGVDLGMQNYNALEQVIGGELWSSAQSSKRWSLISKNNFGHSTISVNDQLHLAKGQSTMQIANKNGASVRINMQDALFPYVKSAVRTLTKEPGNKIIVKDRIETNEQTEKVTWQFMTQAKPHLNGQTITLSQDGKEMKLQIVQPLNPEVHIISLDPPPLEYDMVVKDLKRIDIIQYPDASGEIIEFEVILDGRPANYGERKDLPFEAVKQQFKDPSMIYAPHIFWFWDEPVDAEKMAEMSSVLSAEGFNPGYAHPRHSMVGEPSLKPEQWLTEDWFEAFDAALTEAEKQGTFLGYCDEYWWPSFQAGGRVLKEHPELRAESLSWELLNVPAGETVSVPSSYFAVTARLDQPVEPPAPAPKFGKWIWHPEAEQIEHPCWFRYHLELKNIHQINRVEIIITADNSFHLWLNGEQIGQSNDWEKPMKLNLTEQMQEGQNLIAIEAANVDGLYGLNAGILITYIDGSIRRIPTDKTWLTSLEEIRGWQKERLKEKNWKPAVELAEAGSNPWGVINNKTPFSPEWIHSSSMKVIGQGEPFSWTAPDDGMWRVYVFNKYFHPGAADGQECNSIDSRLAKAFIDIALEPYAQRYGDKMGTSIPGDFIDHEGDYGWQLAWSGSLDSLYANRYQTDIRKHLPLMLDLDIEGRYAKIRWEYFDCVSDLYAGIFEEITDWHEQRGMTTTAHMWEEGIQPQLNCVGDHMKLHRALTMPGNDCLGLKALRVHDFKEAQSVSEFENTRYASEVLGAGDFEPGYGRWGTFTPPLLKQSANAFTAWGVSHVIPHGVFTNRKLENNPWPPDWYNENPMFPWLHLWNNFVRRTSFINSNGFTVPNVLLYNPMESAWMHADAPLLDEHGMWTFNVDRPNADRINEIDQIYGDAITDLTDARVEFLVADRYYLNQMEVRKGQLVRGNMEISTLVLPALDIMSLATARKIVKFAQEGGYVYALEQLPTASSENGAHDQDMIDLMNQLQTTETFFLASASLNTFLSEERAGLQSSVSFISGEFPLIQQRRRIDGRDFYWLVNNTDQPQNCEILVSKAKGGASLWSCENGEIMPIGSSETESASQVRLNFNPYEAFWLVFDPQTDVHPYTEKPQVKEILTLKQNWTVSIDPDIQPDMEFPFVLDDVYIQGIEKPLEEWANWGLERFSGLVDYETTFQLDQTDANLIIDLGEVNHVAEVWLNGQSLGKKLWGPYTFDYSEKVEAGQNSIRVRIANLINNSYGDFKKSGLIGPVRILTKSQQ